MIAIAAGWAGPAVAASEPLAAYLAARVAAADGRARAAADDFAVALGGWPDDPAVAVRAYREAMISGNETLALRAARVLEAEKVAPMDVVLLDLAVAAREGDAKRFDAAVARLDEGPLRILSPSLRGWAAWDRRQPVEPALAGAGKEPVARKLADETRLLIALSARQLDGKAARLLIEAMRPPADTRIASISRKAIVSRGASG